MPDQRLAILEAGADDQDRHAGIDRRAHDFGLAQKIWNSRSMLFRRRSALAYWRSMLSHASCRAL